MVVVIAAFLAPSKCYRRRLRTARLRLEITFVIWRVRHRTEITLFVAKNCGMPHRKLRVVRLTPIALALCEHCNGQFHSRKWIQEEAKAELIEQFDVHECQRYEVNEPDALA